MNSSSTIEMPKSKFEPTVWPKMQKILKISNRGKKKKKNWVLLRNIFRGIFTITHTETKKIHNEAKIKLLLLKLLKILLGRVHF